MNIVLLLSWYDESPSWLATVVAGYGQVVDHIVAVDGSYLFFPNAKPRSHPEQAEAILQTAEAVGVGCTIHRPRDPFEGNEVEKRNLTLKLAAAHDPDWVMVADGDYHVTMCDPDTVRGMLEFTDLNVATYTLVDQQDPLTQPEFAAAAAVSPIETEWRDEVRDIYRWTPDLKYGPAHYTISGTYEGRHQWVKGFGTKHTVGATYMGAVCEPCVDLRGSLVVVHRNRARPMLRQEASKRYYAARDDAAIENVEELYASAEG
jgi:hypothetical protein